MPPDVTELANILHLGTPTTSNILLGTGIAIVAAMALIAPIIFAFRANDPVTILISFVLTGGAVAMMVINRTTPDQIGGFILYLANITLSVVVYAAHRISPKR